MQQDSVFSYAGEDRAKESRKVGYSFANKQESIVNDYLASHKSMKDIPHFDEAKALKDSLVSRISEETGVEYDTVNRTIHKWAVTSNDADPDSLNTQKIASDLFGGKLSDWQKEKIQAVIKDEIEWKKGGGDQTDTTWADIEKSIKGDDTKSVLESMKKETKQMLSDMGFSDDDVIPIYRGVNYKVGSERENILVKANTLESWSFSEDVARKFATGEGTVLYREVKADDVLSSFLSGFGCADEKELVINNVGDYVAEIIAGGN